MMKQLLPEEHLMLASAQRVKALILEEIALENIPGNSNESRELKLSLPQVVEEFPREDYYMLKEVAMANHVISDIQARTHTVIQGKRPGSYD